LPDCCRRWGWRNSGHRRSHSWNNGLGRWCSAYCAYVRGCTGALRADHSERILGAIGRSHKDEWVESPLTAERLTEHNRKVLLEVLLPVAAENVSLGLPACCITTFEDIHILVSGRQEDSEDFRLVLNGATNTAEYVGAEVHEILNNRRGGWRLVVDAVDVAVEKIDGHTASRVSEALDNAVIKTSADGKDLTRRGGVGAGNNGIIAAGGLLGVNEEHLNGKQRHRHRYFGSLTEPQRGWYICVKRL